MCAEVAEVYRAVAGRVMTAVVLAANNGEIGGGEVMLLAVAEALRTLGHDVQVVAAPRRARRGRRGGPGRGLPRHRPVLRAPAVHR